MLYFYRPIISLSVDVKVDALYIPWYGISKSYFKLEC